jgi:uncharacterized protein YbjT (DUF2867 family)
MPISEHRRTVLVTGATGRLGVLVETLLKRGHAVRAMTRNPGSVPAARIRAAGAQVVYGDFDDPATIQRAANGVDALFATGTAHRAGPEGELRHGRNLAAAAAAAAVPHLIYSSGDGAAPESPLQLFRVKHQVEQHIRSLSIAHTILAPVYFMDNLLNTWNLPALQSGEFPSPIPIDKPLQQVAIVDLARFAALVVERPWKFAGERITVASDQLTAEQAAQALSRAVEREFEAQQIHADELAPGLRALFAWLERTGHQVDIARLRRAYPEVGWHSYDAWLHSQRDRLRAICPGEHARAESARRLPAPRICGSRGTGAPDVNRQRRGGRMSSSWTCKPTGSGSIASELHRS